MCRGKRRRAKKLKKHEKCVIEDSDVIMCDIQGVPDRSVSTTTFIAIYFLVAGISSLLMFLLSFIFSLVCCATYVLLSIVIAMGRY